MSIPVYSRQGLRMQCSERVACMAVFACIIEPSKRPFAVTFWNDVGVEECTKAEIRGGLLGFVADRDCFLQVWLYQSNPTSATARTVKVEDTQETRQCFLQIEEVNFSEGQRRVKTLAERLFNPPISEYLFFVLLSEFCCGALMSLNSKISNTKFRASFTESCPPTGCVLASKTPPGIHSWTQ